MAFANLFTNLCEVQEAMKDSYKGDLSNRNRLKNGNDGPSRKRENQAEQTGTYGKKQCFQAAASCGVARKVPSNHNHNTLGNKQSERYTNDGNKHKKKNKGKKKQEKAQRYRHQNNPNKRERGWNKDNKPMPKLLMTQEFKDQNALEVDGRFICIHHLRGTCIKGDDCQLQHIQGYNGLIKEACKFYIQGCCMKGETCPYMHQTFPCKFFHKKGSCRRDNCKFSHDPLNDFTEKLLDDAIKRENELLELNKKDKQEPLGQNENVSAATEENIILQPLRPTFYQSSDANVDEEASLFHTEQGADTTEDTLLQTDDVAPESATPLSLNDPGPVCYSVEAVLGPQIYKPCFYTTPRSQESSTYIPKTTSLNHLNAPYSVTNVLCSQSRLSTANYLPPITHTVATRSKIKERDGSKSLEDKIKVSQFGNTLTNSDKFQEKFVKQPPSLNAVSLERNNEFQNETTSDTKTISELKETKERTNKCILINPVPLDKPSASVLGHLPLIGSTNPAKNCKTSRQMEKLCYSDPKQTFKDKTTASTRTSEMSSNNTSTTNQASSNYPDLQKRSSVQSLDTHQSDCIENVVLSSSLATSCDKTTTGAFNCLFTSLVPDSKQSSNVRTSFTDRHAVPIAPSLQTSPKSERKPSNLIEHETESSFLVSSSATTNSKVQSEVCCGNLDSNKTATRQFHSLFASLHSDITNEPAIPSAQSLPKDQSFNTLQACDPKKATKPSKFTKNNRKGANNKEVGCDLVAKCSETSDILSQMSSPINPHSEGENAKDTTGSYKTSAKSFSSLFEARLSKSNPTKDSAVSKSFQITSQSIVRSVTTREFCDTNHGRKKSNFIEDMAESTHNKEFGACHSVAACSEPSNNPCQKSVSSSQISNSKDKDTKTDIKLFSSLFSATLVKTCPTNESLKLTDNTVHLSDPKVNDKIDYNESNFENKETETCFGTKENSEEQRKNTVCSTSSKSSNKTSTSQGPHDTTDSLSHNGPPNSILRSLFQCLSPYKDPHQIQTYVQPETQLNNIDRGSSPANQPREEA